MAILRHNITSDVRVERHTEQLQRSLNQREVVQFGVGSSGTNQQRKTNLSYNQFT